MNTPVPQLERFPVSPSTIVFRLFLLEEGETLPIKTVELLKENITPATVDEIEVWLGDGSVCDLEGPITIVDPCAEPRKFCTDSPWPIIQVPAWSRETQGKPLVKGWIDLDVPMHPRSAGGQLAILGVMP